ncbi:MAG TPA: ferric reductase-like transmembrane domain-containing protein [Allosphingosinicella sp.]|nr:ferric reductase-like transmembrane domain-containing protein [Allosphingosinicella sp.]
MKRSNALKYLLWMVLAVPAVLLIAQYLGRAENVFPGDFLHPTGEWSARLIILALMLTPLAQLLPASRLVRWLLRHRRAIGLAAFGYAFLHLIFYILDMETVPAVLAELGAPAIWTGWVAFLCMLVPALVSSDGAMRVLKGAWKRLQRLVYPAAILTLVHWALVHDGFTAALASFAPLIALQLIRLFRFLKPNTPQRRTT